MKEKSSKLQAASVKPDRVDRSRDLGYYGSMSSDYQTSGLFRTFKTEKEFHEFVQGHSLPEERRLLWLGFMFGANHAVYKINKDLSSKKK